MQGDRGPEKQEIDTGLTSSEPDLGKTNGDSAAESPPFRNKEIFEETMPSLAGVSDEDLLASRSDPAPLVGETIDNQFKVLEVLGKGGMSVVYKAQYMVLNKIVAIKTMHTHLVSDTSALLRFKQEAQAAIQLDHPNVIKVYHFGITGGDDSRPYIVMDYLEGSSLSEIVKKGERLPIEATLRIFIQVCNALAHAHKHGIIHRDIKPSNIMLMEKDGDPYVVKIVDFGIAKLLPQEGEQAHRLTQTGEIFGSPMYMSPEQCMGRVVDKRSDVYALGCVLYECLGGRPPHHGNNVFETFHKHISEIPASLNIPEADKVLQERLDAIVFKALEKDPDKRYQSMSDFEEDLRSVERDLESGLRGTGLRLGFARQQRSVQRFIKQAPKAVLAMGAVALILLAGSLAFWTKFAWFFQAHNFQATPTRWMDFLPPLHKKIKLSAAEKQKRLDEGRIALSFAQVKNADDSPYLLKMWQERAQKCAEIDAPADEIEARNQIMAILRSEGATNDLSFGKEAEELAEVLISQSDFQSARPLLEDAILIREKIYMPTARSYLDLGYVYGKLGKYKQSLVQLNEALSQIEEKGASSVGDFRTRAITKALIADNYRMVADLKNADTNYADSEKVVTASNSSSLKSTAILLNELVMIRAYVSLLTGQYAEAADKYGRILQFAEKRFANRPDIIQTVYDGYAYAAWKAGDISTAAKMHERSEAIGNANASSKP